jgi:hypothetical protein
VLQFVFQFWIELGLELMLRHPLSRNPQKSEPLCVYYVKVAMSVLFRIFAVP